MLGHRRGMATNVTFHGQGVDVVLEDRTVRLVDGASGEDQVEIARSDIGAVELKPATLLGYGRRVVTTRAGATHTVEFATTAQDHFENLEVIIRP